MKVLSYILSFVFIFSLGFSMPVDKSMFKKNDVTCCDKMGAHHSDEEKNNCCHKTDCAICHCIQMIAILNSEETICRTEFLEGKPQFIYQVKGTLVFNLDHFHPPEFTS